MICAALCCLLASTAPRAYAGPSGTVPSLVAGGLGHGTIALDGPWQFHTGDDPSWASPKLDDSNWEQIDASRPWGDQGHSAYTGFAWYRRHVTFPSTEAGGQPNPEEAAIFLPRASCLYEVYWEGVRISLPGPMPSGPISQYSPAQVLPLGSPRDGVLAIRVWTAPLDSSSGGDDRGLMMTPRLANLEAAKSMKAEAEGASLKSILVQFALILIYAQIALFGFLIWLRSRDQQLLKWTVIFFAAATLSVLSNPQIFPWLYDSPILFFSPGYTVEDIALWYLLIYLLDVDRNTTLMRWTRILAWIAIVSAFADNFLFLVKWSSAHILPFQVLDAIFTAGFSVVEILPFVIIGLALRKRLDPARWFVAATALLSKMFDVVQHTASEGQRFTHWTLGDRLLDPLFTVNDVPVSVPAILSTALVCALVYSVYRFTVEQGQLQTALQQEFKSAQELQRVLIPDVLPTLPGYAITSAYRPAAEVGGDFFQLIPLTASGPEDAQGSALLVVGDVSGKGLKAAMAVSMIVGALRTLAEFSHDPATILAGMNRRIVGRLTDGFVTCLVLRINKQGACVVANAGHLAPFLNRSEIALEGSLPLGLVPEVHYENISLSLEIGDRLTLYTDGLPEARNAVGEMFGFDRMAALLESHPDASRAVAAAVDFGQGDDITVLTLTRLATGVEPTTLLIAPRLLKSQTEKPDFVERQSSISAEQLSAKLREDRG